MASSQRTAAKCACAIAATAVVIAHVAALRLGLVVVPFNTAYKAREGAHIAGLRQR